mgnify:FL=1
MEKIYSVAVDGPSGAGKSTLAKAAAAELHIIYVDTGAIYRTIGCYARRQGVDAADTQAVIALLPQVKIEMRYDEQGLQHMLLHGEDVTREIRLPEMSLYASAVSAIPEVRSFLLEMQRDFARRSSVIMDGRDIGTVVLPHADVKIFLQADVAVRARRREKELQERGTPRPFDQVLAEMKERDYNDTHRAAAPLRPAADAVIVDTSEMDFRQSEEALLDVIRRKVGV